MVNSEISLNQEFQNCKDYPESKISKILKRANYGIKTGPGPWGCGVTSYPLRIQESMLFGKNEKLVGKFKK